MGKYSFTFQNDRTIRAKRKAENCGNCYRMQSWKPKLESKSGKRNTERRCKIAAREVAVRLPQTLTAPSPASHSHGGRVWLAGTLATRHRVAGQFIDCPPPSAQLPPPPPTPCCTVTSQTRAMFDMITSKFRLMLYYTQLVDSQLPELTRGKSDRKTKQYFSTSIVEGWTRAHTHARTRTHACTHARTNARPPARTRARTGSQTRTQIVCTSCLHYSK